MIEATQPWTFRQDWQVVSCCRPSQSKVSMSSSAASKNACKQAFSGFELRFHLEAVVHSFGYFASNFQMISAETDCAYLDPFVKHDCSHLWDVQSPSSGSALLNMSLKKPAVTVIWLDQNWWPEATAPNLTKVGHVTQFEQWPGYTASMKSSSSNSRCNVLRSDGFCEGDDKFSHNMTRTSSALHQRRLPGSLEIYKSNLSQPSDAWNLCSSC